MELINDSKDSDESLASPKAKGKRFIVDFHIHSKYARATSKDLNIDTLNKWAKIKGLNVIGTGDFQHPKWNVEIKEKLEEDENGILWLKGSKREVGKDLAFIWQTEISLMFAKDGRRAVHLLVFAPNGKVVDEIIKYLLSKGRIDYDGRPIFGITCKQFVHDLKEINDLIEIIPAHCMTPWFGIFGSDTGFDSLRECFEEQAEKIYAIESGMSASPDMLWRFKENVNIVSFSDSHSFWPFRLGREATIFEVGELSYKEIIKAIRTGEGLIGTIETPPEYGKYHYDGHRNCGFSCSPSETKKLNGICPKCGKKLTIGVDYRVDEIAKEGEGYRPEKAKMFFKLLPLHELIALNLKSGMESKKTWEAYNELIGKFGNELKILLDVSREDLLKEEIDEKLVELILFNRKGKLQVKPGFDGEYGEVLMPEKQGKLF